MYGSASAALFRATRTNADGEITLDALIQPWARHVSEWNVWPTLHPRFVSAEQNTIGIMQAIKEVAAYEGSNNGVKSTDGSWRGGQLLIGPGAYEIADTIDMSHPGDRNVNIHILGTGVSSTSITAKHRDKKFPLFVIGPDNNTGGSANHRGIVLEKFSLNKGSIGLKLGANTVDSTTKIEKLDDNGKPVLDEHGKPVLIPAPGAWNSSTTYNHFIDLEFWQQEQWCIKADRCRSTVFTRCNLRHTYPGNSLRAFSSSIRFDSCTIGEAAGSIIVIDSGVYLNGCHWFDSVDTRGAGESIADATPEGIAGAGGEFGYGRYMAEISGDGALFLNGTSVVFNRGVKRPKDEKAAAQHRLDYPDGVIGIRNGRFHMNGGSYGTTIPHSTMITINEDILYNRSTRNGPLLSGVRIRPTQSEAPDTTLIGIGGNATTVRQAIVVANMLHVNPSPSAGMKIRLHPSCWDAKNHNRICENSGMDNDPDWLPQSTLWSPNTPPNSTGVGTEEWKQGQRIWNSAPTDGAPAGWVFDGSRWLSMAPLTE